MNANELLTVEEVAHRLRLHAESVRRLLREGDLRGFRLAGRWRISEKDLDDFLERRRQDMTGGA
ncbi:MAG TPA: helix-turn-helix domain-containing protein [Dehalococcoidia bacterium]|nr:helix-turn-helix domain-containing protein [Dehalococcoidia bacterium]